MASRAVLIVCYDITRSIKVCLLFCYFLSARQSCKLFDDEKRPDDVIPEIYISSVARRQKLPQTVQNVSRRAFIYKAENEEQYNICVKGGRVKGVDGPFQDHLRPSPQSVGVFRTECARAARSGQWSYLCDSAVPHDCSIFFVNLHFFRLKKTVVFVAYI